MVDKLQRRRQYTGLSNVVYVYMHPRNKEWIERVSKKNLISRSLLLDSIVDAVRTKRDVIYINKARFRIPTKDELAIGNQEKTA